MLKKLLFTSAIVIPVGLLPFVNVVVQNSDLHNLTKNLMNEDEYRILMQDLLDSFHDQNTSFKNKLPSEIGEVNQVVSQEELGIFWVKIPNYFIVELSIKSIDDKFGQLSVDVKIYEKTSNEQNEEIILLKGSRVMNISDFKNKFIFKSTYDISYY